MVLPKPLSCSSCISWLTPHSAFSSPSTLNYELSTCPPLRTPHSNNPQPPTNLKSPKTLALALILACGLLTPGRAQTSGGNPPVQSPTQPPSDPAAVTLVSPQYVLRPGDVVQIKVYQEEDLSALSRLDKEGSLTMPLLGLVAVGGNTVAQATAKIQELLGKDYLVNPQVNLNVTEFARRRFTVLGQAQRPGTYDMPADDTVTLLQAVATAGGYTRIGNPRKITVQRLVGAETKQIKLDADAMANKKEKPFEILPDDVIIIGEKWI